MRGFGQPAGWALGRDGVCRPMGHCPGGCPQIELGGWVTTPDWAQVPSGTEVHVQFQSDAAYTPDEWDRLRQRASFVQRAITGAGFQTNWDVRITRQAGFGLSPIFVDIYATARTGLPMNDIERRLREALQSQIPGDYVATIRQVLDPSAEPAPAPGPVVPSLPTGRSRVYLLGGAVALVTVVGIIMAWRSR